MIYRGSIEAGYASIARFMAAHPSPWGWNPTQYCGLPTQFTYLPVIPYASAALMWLLPDREPSHLYRIAVSTPACLGPVTIFFFVLYFTRSHWWALATAGAYTLFSPSYGLINLINYDRGLVQLPWRVQLLAKYGEGPHNAGLTLMPLAILAVWAAGMGRRYWQILLAAITLAAVTLTNWVAALALAFCCAVAIVTAAGNSKLGFRSMRVLAAAVLAYLLACFWLTPRFPPATASRNSSKSSRNANISNSRA